MEIHTLLKMPPFQGITEEELLSLILAPEHARRQYKPADFIAMQGEAYRSLFILCSGSVRTQMVSAEGKQLTIETLKAPQLPHMININIGNNAELMEKCRLLHDYAVFIGLIRDYISQENDINTAVTLAINQAISHNILKEVLSVHIAEVRDMILTEYNEEQHIKNEKNISYDDGFNDGIEQTKIEAIKNMIKLNVPKDKIIECYSEAEYNVAIKDDRN